MRFAKATFAVAMVLFLAGGFSLAGSWAVSVGCLLFLVAAIVGAVVMEERDLDAVEGLVPLESSAAPDVIEDGGAGPQGPLLGAA
jgi:hypothetical protein